LVAKFDNFPALAAYQVGVSEKVFVVAVPIHKGYLPQQPTLTQQSQGAIHGSSTHGWALVLSQSQIELIGLEVAGSRKCLL